MIPTHTEGTCWGDLNGLQNVLWIEPAPGGATTVEAAVLEEQRVALRAATPAGQPVVLVLPAADFVMVARTVARECNLPPV